MSGLDSKEPLLLVNPVLDSNSFVNILGYRNILDFQCIIAKNCLDTQLESAAKNFYFHNSKLCSAHLECQFSLAFTL